MHDSLKTIMWVILFIIFSALLYDVKQASRAKAEVKRALNKASNAATLMVDKDPIKISQGIFEIDPVLSKTIFQNYLAENLGTIPSEVTLFVVDHQALNTHTLIEYTNPVDGKKYKFDRPAFIAVMKFNYKGIFINYSFPIDNLGGSRMTEKPAS